MCLGCFGSHGFIWTVEYTEDGTRSRVDFVINPLPSQSGQGLGGIEALAIIIGLRGWGVGFGV